MGDKGPKSKVARLIEEYEMEEIGEEMLKRWTRSEGRDSLRDLADYFNQELLRVALNKQGRDPIDGEVENFYRLLTDETTTSGVKQEARDNLTDYGVDVESIEDDFISYQAVRTYLKKYRDASPPESVVSPDQDRENKENTIQRLKNRLQTVTDRALSDLKTADNLKIGKFEVIVTVRIHCKDCNSQRPASRILAEGGCDCDNTST